EGLRTGARRDAHGLASRRGAGGGGGDARPLASIVLALAARRQGGGDDRWRVSRRCTGCRRRGRGCLDRRLPRLPLRLSGLDRRSTLFAGGGGPIGRALAGGRLRGRRGRGGPRAASR